MTISFISMLIIKSNLLSENNPTKNVIEAIYVHVFVFFFFPLNSPDKEGL